MRATRLKDIAIAAEVSMPVVSDILNNKGNRFRPETREKIWRLAREMNYNPAFSGKSLATGEVIISVCLCRLVTALPYPGII